MTGEKAEFRTWGPYSAFGMGLALFTAALDQIHKWWMLNVYDIEAKGQVTVTPFLDLVMVWNPGISYGLLPADTLGGRLVLIGIALAAVGGLTIWLARVGSVIGAAGIGLLIGGAVGNAVDRAAYGAVADFFSFHVGDFYWYVFNFADAAIVAGVIGLLYDSLFISHKKVSKSS